ncbi:MAG: hypothetical protein ACRD03_01190 [Acidimicrobiales bacterium]
MAFGTRQTFDPSGTKMAYVSDRGGALVVRDVTTEAERSFDTGEIPAAASGNVISGLRALAWVDDRRLAVLMSRLVSPQRCGPLGNCPTTTTAVPTTPTSQVLIFDPETEELEDATVLSAPVGATWAFLARGSGSAELVVAERPSSATGEAPWNIVAIGTDTPGTRLITSLPPFALPLSIDSSGQHLLFQGLPP